MSCIKRSVRKSLACIAGVKKGGMGGTSKLKMGAQNGKGQGKACLLPHFVFVFFYFCLVDAKIVKLVRNNSVPIYYLNNCSDWSELIECNLRP